MGGQRCDPSLPTNLGCAQLSCLLRPCSAPSCGTLALTAQPPPSGLYYKNLPPGHDVERFKKLPHGRLFFDIPVDDFFSEACQEDGDPVLLDLIAPEKLVPVLEKIVGPEVRLVGVQARTVPPESEGGYTSW